MVREIYPKGLQKICNIQPLFSLFFSSISFEVVRNQDWEAELGGFLLPDVVSAEAGEGNDTVVFSLSTMATGEIRSSANRCS